jgi:hypothetical protein
MIWWFLILGLSTLVVVCVAIALFIHLRRHLQKAYPSHEGAAGEIDHQRDIERPKH